MGRNGTDGFRRFRRAQEGSNAVEFALLLPVFLLLLFGMVGYGLYLGAAHSLASLASEGARSSLAGLDADERRSLSRDLVRSTARLYPLIDPDRLEVDIVEEATSVRVTVSYDASDFPIWGYAFARIFPSPLIVRSAATELVVF